MWIVATKKCRFCRELMIRSLDDYTHRICQDCWEEINECFVVLGFTDEEQRRAGDDLEKHRVVEPAVQITR